MFRRTLRSLPVSLAVTLSALALAGPASADGHAWRHPVPPHHHARYYLPHYVEHHSHAYPVYHYADPEAYYCGPCGHHFDSYEHLSYHVHEHHHIAVLALPTVIFQASIGGGVGWVFGD